MMQEIGLATPSRLLRLMGLAFLARAAARSREISFSGFAGPAQNPLPF
jgi:hypothetical protein